MPDAIICQSLKLPVWNSSWKQTMSQLAMQRVIIWKRSFLKSFQLFLMGGGRRNRLQLHSLTLSEFITNIITASISMKGRSLPNTSSLAAKYGVSMKQNASLGSMGLNPNLNIEDEYIENLLKQIHFMSLEIKLVKEKQAKSDGNALWGVINRTGQPYTTNIVESSKKYEDMKKQTNSVISRLQKEISGLANQQGALMAELGFLENKRATLIARKSEQDQEYSLKQKKMNEKITKQQQKLNQLRSDLKKERQKNDKLRKEHQSIEQSENAQKAKQVKERIQIENDEKIQELMEKDKDAEVQSYENSIKKLEDLFAQNVDYLRAQEEQAVLVKRISQLDSSVSTANFNLMQLQESIKMSDLDREKEIRERKKVTEDFEFTKTMLMQILDMNLSRKDKEIQNRKKQSPQICNAQEQTERLQKNLKEIKTKLAKAEETHHKLSLEVGAYNRDLEIEKENQKKLKQKCAQINAQNDQRDSHLITLQSQVRELSDQCEKVIVEETNSSMDLFEMQKEISFLKARRELLQESMELKEVVNGLKVEDLQKVVQKNNDLNSTVATLMSKWDQIKSFSRI